MIQPGSNSNNDKLILYQCKFQLHIHDLEAQIYFPSSFQIVWKTKDNDQLAVTTGFVHKNQIHLARFNQTLEAQTVMIYNKLTRSYLEKDTFIVVTYYLNSKPTEVKELGRITLKMSRFMDESGDSTVRKGEKGLGTFRDEKDQKTGTGLQKRNGIKQKQSDELKCLRLENSQYLAKLKFKCSLIQSSVSKLSLSSISQEEFNQPLSEQIKTTKKPMTKSPEAKTIPVSIKQKQSPRPNIQNQSQKRSSKQKATLIQRAQIKDSHFQQGQSSSQLSNVEQQQLKQSNHSQNTKESTFQESLIIPSSINELSKHQHEDKVLAQLEHLEKDNFRLTALCQHQKEYIIDQEQVINTLKQDFFELEEQLKEKELYLQNNLHKLETLDHCKYELIEIKEYVAKLEERLIMVHAEKPAILENFWKTITGSRKSLISKPQILKKPSLVQSIVKISSISLIDENSDQKKTLTESVNFVRPATVRDSQQKQKQSHKSIPQHLFMISSSQIQLTNSQMRQIEGSTVRMQKELSFMQTQLYEVKGNVHLQQQRYEAECIMHSETKMELFNLQEKMKNLQKQLKENRSVNQEKQSILKQLNKLYEDNECLHRQIDRLQQIQLQMRQQNFKLKQGKEQQEYQMSVAIKHQKIQLQSLKDQIAKQSLNVKQLQDSIVSERDRLKQQGQQNLKIKSQLSSVIKQNFTLNQQIQTMKNKQTQIATYLSGLQGQFAQIQKIVQEKEDNEQQLHQLILQKEQIILKKQCQISSQECRIKNFQLLIDNIDKQLALQRIKFCSYQSQQSINSCQSPKQQQSRLKLTMLQSSNNQLIKKNKELIAIISKNATALITYEKQKKQLSALTNISNQLQIIKQHNILLQSQNNKLIKENHKINNHLKQIQTKHSEHIHTINLQNQTLNQTLTQQQNINLNLQQTTNNLKQRLLYQQYLLSQKNSQIAQNQTKITKFTKENKLLQDSLKFFQSKIKQYQSLILQHQSNISEKQSLIKSLQTKLKTIETHHLNNNSLKTSLYRPNDQGLSQIKLQSEIYDSRKIYQLNDSRKVYTKQYFSANHNKYNKPPSKQSDQQNNIYKKDQSVPESVHNESSYLISPLSENEQERIKRHQTFKIGQDTIYYNKRKRGEKQRDSVMISMIQSYLDARKQTNQNQQLQGMIERLKQLQQNNIGNTNNHQTYQQIVTKAHEVQNQLSKYKTKIIKDLRDRPKLTIDTLIESIKPFEHALNSLLITVAILK